MFNSLSMIENIDSVIKGLAQKSDALVFACTRVPCHQCVFMYFVLLLNAKHELLMLWHVACSRALPLQNGIALVVVTPSCCHSGFVCPAVCLCMCVSVCMAQLLLMWS